MASGISALMSEWHVTCVFNRSTLGQHGTEPGYTVQSSWCSLQYTCTRWLVECLSKRNWWNRFNYQIQRVILLMLGRCPTVSPWRKLPDPFSSQHWTVVRPEIASQIMTSWCILVSGGWMAHRKISLTASYFNYAPNNLL